jgi:hypothetical protein
MNFASQTDPAFDKDLAESFAAIESKGKKLLQRTKDRVKDNLTLHREGMEAVFRSSLTSKTQNFDATNLIRPFVKRSRLSKVVLPGRLPITSVLAYVASFVGLLALATLMGTLSKLAYSELNLSAGLSAPLFATGFLGMLSLAFATAVMGLLYAGCCIIRDRYWYRVDRDRMWLVSAEACRAWYIGDERLYVYDTVDVSEVIKAISEDTDIDYDCMKGFGKAFDSRLPLLSEVEYRHIGEVVIGMNTIRIVALDGRLIVKMFVGENRHEDIMRYASEIKERVRSIRGGGIEGTAL